MGAITIDGFGVVEIKGDVPDDEEQQAILDAIGKKEDIDVNPEEFNQEVEKAAASMQVEVEKLKEFCQQR